jgi:hypothetical protein
VLAGVSTAAQAAALAPGRRPDAVLAEISALPVA